MRSAPAIALASALAALLPPRDASAEPAWRYGAAIGIGLTQIDGRRFDEVELTLQGARRITPDWWLVAHLHDLQLQPCDDRPAPGRGHRLGLGIERTFASWTEDGAGAFARVRGGFTRETVHWDRGRLDRAGAYLELRGVVDFDVGRNHRWFGLGMSVRVHAHRTPALIDTGPTAAAGSTRSAQASYDAGILFAWEFVAGR